jgi:hypothetical protein
MGNDLRNNSELESQIKLASTKKNLIEMIEFNSFSGLINLAYLILRNNIIKSFHVNFIGLVGLNLENNFIELTHKAISFLFNLFV